jgi:hypothetical protein
VVDWSQQKHGVDNTFEEPDPKHPGANQQKIESEAIEEKTERKKAEVVERIDRWNGHPKPWTALGEMYRAIPGGKAIVESKMYFSREEAEQIYASVGDEYRIPLLYHLLLDRQFLENNLE